MGISLTAEPLLSLAVTVTSEQRVESVLQRIVQGLASQPGIALARIWLLPSVHHPSFYDAVSDTPDCLCLVASVGTPINSSGEDWCFLRGHFARVPFKVGKVGDVAATRRPILVEDVAAQNDWIVRPEWAKREKIRSFAGHPLIFRDKLLGVIAVFSRQPLGRQEFTWLGLFANQAALAIANACSEQALRSSERELASLVNTIPTAAWTTRPDGYCDFLNQVWLDYAGMTAEQAQGWGWAEAFHPDDRNKLVEQWQSCLASGFPVDTEARIRRYDGSYRWFLIRGNPLRNEDGKILKWYGTCVDIEDRKRREEDLHARELEVRSFFDNTPGLLARLSPDGTPRIFNPPFLQYLGKTAQEIGQWRMNDIVHSDDLTNTIEVFGKAISTGQPVEFEYRLRRFDGAYRWFQARMVPVHSAEGELLHWNALVTDIDDRKKAEEALQSSERNLKQMINAIPAVIGLMRTDGKPMYGNQGVTDYTGLSAEDMLKEDFRERIFHPDDMERLREERQLAFTRAIPFELEQRVLGKDGKYRWFLFRYKPLLDEVGKIDRWYMAATDIDDRKKAEEALRSSERNLSLMINVIPTIIAVLGTDGSMLFANQTALHFTGLTLEDVQKKDSRSRIFHPDDVEKLREQREAALTRAVPFENEQRVLAKDGQYRWFLIRYNPLLDEQGKIDRWYVAAADIEDLKRLDDARRRAEEALRQSEEKARLIVDSIDGLIMTATPEGEVEFVNQQVLDYFGKSLEELKDWRTNDAIHQDDLPRALALWTHSLETGDAYLFDQRLRRAEGAYRWFRVRGRCLRDTQGHIVRWYLLLTDIDEGKYAESQVEQAYLRLAEAQRLSKTGSFITDLLADEHNWSEEAFRIFEFDPAARVTVQLIRNTIHPEDLPTFEAVIARGMTGADVDFGFRIVTSRGALKYLRGMARVMGQSEGHPLFIGALQDVTQSKLAEEALDKARAELAHVARIATLNALTASIAHEINQPLSGIITNAGTCRRMLDGDPPNIEGARETARRIIRDGNRASDVISHLRALFTKRDFVLEPLDLNEATREVMALSLSDLQRNRVVLLSDLAADLPCVMGDRVQLQQVILNLVRNASDAMVGVEDRPKELLIKTQRDENDQVRLSVIDAGVGLAPENIDKLFEAFHTTKIHGMGIGLSVSRSIIERHHGRIWGEPNAGPGATFSFSIPCDLCE